jgi:hypothetical protein
VLDKPSRRPIEPAAAANAVPNSAPEPVHSTDSADPAEAVRHVARNRSESRAVLSAVNALRGDPPNPDDAAMLLTYYRQHFPGGELAEEALALFVEVEWRRKSDKALVYARQYEESYPAGRYLRAVRAIAARARSVP